MNNNFQWYELPDPHVRMWALAYKGTSLLRIRRSHSNLAGLQWGYKEEEHQAFNDYRIGRTDQISLEKAQAKAIQLYINDFLNKHKETLDMWGRLQELANSITEE